MNPSFLLREELIEKILEALAGHVSGDLEEIKNRLRNCQLFEDRQTELADYGLEILRVLGGCECRILALRSHVLLAVIARSEYSLSEIARNFKVCRATTSHIACKFKRSLGLQNARTTRSGGYSEQCRHRQSAWGI